MPGDYLYVWLVALVFPKARIMPCAPMREPDNARGPGRWRPYALDLAPRIAELERADALEGRDRTASVRSQSSPSRACVACGKG